MTHLATLVCDRYLISHHLWLSVLHPWALISLLPSFSCWHYHSIRTERIRLGEFSMKSKSQVSFSSQEAKTCVQSFQKSLHYSGSWMPPAQGTSLPLQISKTLDLICCQGCSKFCWVHMRASLGRRSAQDRLSWFLICHRTKICSDVPADTAKTSAFPKQILLRRWSQLLK